MPEKILKDLLPNKVYNVQVRAVADETESEWSPVLKVDTAAVINLFGNSGMKTTTLQISGRRGGWGGTFGDKITLHEGWPAKANSSSNVKMLTPNKVLNHHAVNLIGDGYFSPTGAYWQLYTEAIEVPYRPGKKYYYANGGSIQFRTMYEPPRTIMTESIPGGFAAYAMIPTLIAVATTGLNKGRYVHLDIAIPPDIVIGNLLDENNPPNGMYRTTSASGMGLMPRVNIDEVTGAVGPVRIFSVYSLEALSITGPAYIYGPTQGDTTFKLDNLRVLVS